MSFLKRLFRSLFSLRMLGRCLFVFVLLCTLIALVIVEENWRQKRAWENYARAQETGDGVFDYRALVPQPVPDELNFATTPLLRPLYPDGGQYGADLQRKLELPKTGDKPVPSLVVRASGRRVDLQEWKASMGMDVMDALAKFDPEMREISQAVRRRYSVFPVAYEKGFGANIPHGSVMMKLVRLYTLRAVAELHSGRHDAAATDAQTIILLADSVKNEPLLISLLVRNALLQNALQVVWEGTEDHLWTDAELVALQSDLSRENLVPGLLLAFRGEQMFFNETMQQAIADPRILPIMISMSGEPKESGFRFIPSALIYANRLSANRWYAALEKTVQLSPASASFAASRELEKELMGSATVHLFGLAPPNLYNALAILAIPSIARSSEKMICTQVTIDEAQVACALERYRLANGAYPATLENLVPAFLQKQPVDIVNGSPLHYRLKDDGHFLLYSVGYNNVDDGGKVVLEKNGRVKIEEGDWVW